MTTPEQMNRIVHLVADLTRRNRDGEASAHLAELAGRLGTTARQIGADIRTLTLLDNDSDADWLLSIRVGLEGDRVSITSAGPYRRPIRFTTDEVMAMQIGLNAVSRSAPVLTDQLARLLARPEPQPAALSHPIAGDDGFSETIRHAIDHRRKIEIKYTSEGAGGGIGRVVHPYQLVARDGRSYLIAWCERVEDWRRFRFDRIIDLLATEQPFVWRDDLAQRDLTFDAPADGVDQVVVRFSPAVSRWARERYPAADTDEMGRTQVTFQVANPAWLVSQVLQYGADAEVIAPAEYRELMRRTVT